MANIILKEREYAEEILSSTGYIKSPGKILGLIARHYFYMGYNKNNIDQKLKEFLLKNDPQTNIVKWQKYIDIAIRNAPKRELADIDFVPITNKEMQTISDNIESVQEKRLCFVLLCLAKLCNQLNKKNNNWTNYSDKDIFELANIKAPIKRQSTMFHNLRSYGLIEFSRSVNNMNTRVLFVDEDNDFYIRVNDFRNLGLQYMSEAGVPIIRCLQCGIACKKKTNNQKYCNDCSVQIKREKDYNRKKLKSTHSEMS